MVQTPHLAGSALPTECRLIVDGPGPGPWNMAIDEALLVDAAESGIATLRFYEWSRPTLSLGYFQRYEDRFHHAASRDCAIVRRQTGGGAILHDRELTYSLVLPASHPTARHSQQLYSAVHEAFTSVLKPLIVSKQALSILRCEGRASPLLATQEPFLCFARRACGDVLLVTDLESGTKILGSAQRRHRRAILQHGSLLLEKSPLAPELAGWLDVAGIPVSTPALVEGVIDQIAEALGLRLIPTRVPAELQTKVEELTNNKYGLPAWTKRR
jgi:lipoyl(octanoyl) transferase